MANALHNPRPIADKAERPIAARADGKPKYASFQLAPFLFSTTSIPATGRDRPNICLRELVQCIYASELQNSKYRVTLHSPLQITALWSPAPAPTPQPAKVPYDPTDPKQNPLNPQGLKP